MTNFNKFEASNYIKNEQQAINYLKVMLDENGVESFLIALGEVARSQGMGNIAEKTGLGRESLYKSFSSKGNPNFKSVVKTLNALNIDLNFDIYNKKEVVSQRGGVT
jgi:probable addiction module antidote protein